MLKYSVLASCLTASLSAIAPLASEDGYWCAVKNSPDLKPSETSASKLISFRGDYRDFSIFVESNKDALTACSVFKAHVVGDDGLWVIEEPSTEVADKTKKTLAAAGLPIYYDAGASFIVGGGVDVPNISGLDGCGADEDTSFIPVPSHSITPPVLTDWMREEFSVWNHFEEDPIVATAVAAVSEESLIKSIQSLQAFHTRNSYSDTIHSAQDFIAAELTSMGYNVDFMHFRSDMSANIIATLPGNYDEWVVAGAHYDSRSTNSSSGTMRAPGADDNGSGTSAILEVASIIKQMEVQFKRGVRICFFSGEEQGLLGSRALAGLWKEQGENIAAMVNADMLGYQATAEVTLGFKDKSVTPELVTLAKHLTTVYVPGLPTADSSSCCSDYLSFWEEGYPSVGFFENGEAASNYPNYHTSEDLLDSVNTAQLTLETQAVVATVLTLLV